MSRRRAADIVGGDEDEDVSLAVAQVHSVLGGVSVMWLMKAFGMGRQTVERRLVGCQPIGQGRNAAPLYRLADAASYLVNPRMDMAKYIASIGPDELPDKLRDSYWAAKLKRQKWEKYAGHLWPSEVVLETFSEILQAMRTKLQLLPDGIERNAGLNDEQRRVVTQLVDDLQRELHEYLVKFAAERATPSQLGEEDEDDE